MLIGLNAYSASEPTVIITASGSSSVYDPDWGMYTTVLNNSANCPSGYVLTGYSVNGGGWCKTITTTGVSNCNYQYHYDHWNTEGLRTISAAPTIICAKSCGN